MPIRPIPYENLMLILAVKEKAFTRSAVAWIGIATLLSACAMGPPPSGFAQVVAGAA